MKKFRKFTILWGVILVLIFVLFTMYSFKLDKKIKEYRSLEEYFANAVAEYNNSKKDSITAIQINRVFKLQPLLLSFTVFHLEIDYISLLLFKQEKTAGCPTVLIYLWL